MPISNLSSGSRPGVCTSTTRPTAPFEGQMIYETDTNRVLVWDNAAWVMIADTDQPPGMQLVKSQTIGNAVTSIPVTDVFSSEFDNYLLTINGGTASTGGFFTLQLGSTTSGYYEVRTGFNLAGGTTINSTVDGSFFYVGHYNTSGKYCYDTILNPFSSVNTWHTTGMFTFNTSRMDQSQGFLNNTTSYTGFTIGTSAGNVTGGTIRVYGYRN